MTDSLSAIDPQLQSWAESHDLKLLTFDESRYVYLGSQHDCCQIWLVGPLKDQIVVRATDVEALLDDAELDFAISVPLADLESGLEEAFRQVQSWFARPGAQT
jgi:hypothetical protein